MAEEGLLSQVKRVVVGEPIPSHLAHHERLSRFTGLAVLSSDPLSSVAYATEEILRVLILVGVSALSFVTPIAFVIATILAIVVFSYRQTIYAYPCGGGAYIVSKDNLGETPALIAAGALLIDYVLTVAVSIAAGVAAIASAFPDWQINRVEMTLGFALILMLGNLPAFANRGGSLPLLPISSSSACWPLNRTNQILAPPLRFGSVDVHTHDLVLLGNSFFRGPAEAVKALFHRDTSESDLRQKRDELCLRQSAGDSTGPEIDVSPDGLRQLARDDDIAVQEATAWL